jgi:hypothetical protein
MRETMERILAPRSIGEGAKFDRMARFGSYRYVLGSFREPLLNRLFRVVAVLALLPALGACTLDSGMATDAGPCQASPRFFASDVWPRYLQHNSCGRSSCHAESSGFGYFRLQPALEAPPIATPLSSWPADWRANYYASVQLVRCDEPLQSLLLTTPAGQADHHPPGISVDNLAESMQLFQKWVTAP